MAARTEPHHGPTTGIEAANRPHGPMPKSASDALVKRRLLAVGVHPATPPRRHRRCRRWHAPIVCRIYVRLFSAAAMHHARLPPSRKEAGIHVIQHTFFRAGRLPATRWTQSFLLRLSSTPSPINWRWKNRKKSIDFCWLRRWIVTTTEPSEGSPVSTVKLSHEEGTILLPHVWRRAVDKREKKGAYHGRSIVVGPVSCCPLFWW